MSSGADTTVAASEKERNVAVVRGFYEAEDVPALLEFPDPRIEWRGPDSLPWGGTFRGHDGFREFFAIVVDQIAAEFRLEKQEYLDAGERVVVLLRSIGRPKGGTAWDLPEVHVWTVRHGKTVSMDNYIDTATVLGTLPDMNPQRELEQ